MLRAGFLHGFHAAFFPFAKDFVDVQHGLVHPPGALRRIGNQLAGMNVHPGFVVFHIAALDVAVRSANLQKLAHLGAQLVHRLNIAVRINEFLKVHLCPFVRLSAQIIEAVLALAGAFGGGETDRFRLKALLQHTGKPFQLLRRRQRCAAQLAQNIFQGFKIVSLSAAAAFEDAVQIRKRRCAGFGGFGAGGNDCFL